MRRGILRVKQSHGIGNSEREHEGNHSFSGGLEVTLSEFQPQIIRSPDHTSRLMWSIVGVFGLTLVHFFCCTCLANHKRGSGWFGIGSVDSPWTPIAWLPAGVFFYIEDRFDVFALGSVGVVLVLCGSLATAVSTFSAIRALTSPCGRRFGSCAWKLWLPVLLWVVWVPVTFEMTWTYQHTVKY